MEPREGSEGPLLRGLPSGVSRPQASGPCCDPSRSVPTYTKSSYLEPLRLGRLPNIWQPRDWPT
eukprot:1721603-Alexandrium_andersonii.AAC.1